MSEYQHSYRGVYLSGATIFPSRVAHSHYLRFCCYLIYLLITEAEESQSAEVGSADGNAALLSDAVIPCIKQ